MVVVTGPEETAGSRSEVKREDARAYYATIRRGLEIVRERRGLSLRELAAEIEQSGHSSVSVSSIGRLFHPDAKRPTLPNLYLVHVTLATLGTTLEEVEALGAGVTSEMPTLSTQSRPERQTDETTSPELVVRSEDLPVEGGSIGEDEMQRLRNLVESLGTYEHRVMCNGFGPWSETALNFGFDFEQVRLTWTRGMIQTLVREDARWERRGWHCRILLLAFASAHRRLGARTAAITRRLGTFADKDGLEEELKSVDSLLAVEGANSAFLRLRSRESDIFRGIGPTTASMYLYYLSWAIEPLHTMKPLKPVPMKTDAILALRELKYLRVDSGHSSMVDYGEYLVAVASLAKDLRTEPDMALDAALSWWVLRPRRARSLVQKRRDVNEESAEFLPVDHLDLP